VIQIKSLEDWVATQKGRLNNLGLMEIVGKGSPNEVDTSRGAL
jgi:hypothetical protein